MNSKQRFRSRFILIIVMAAGAVLVSTLYWRQIENGAAYAAKADKQYVKPSANLFDRGSIFWSSKDDTKAAAAAIGSGYLIYMNPTLLADPAGAYEALSQYITLDRADFMRKAGRKTDPYEEIMHRVEDDKAQSIGALAIPGIGVTRETWRSYPGGALASHVLGLVGQTETAGVEGRYGLESFYEKALSRRVLSSGSSVFAEIFGGLRDSVFGSAGEGAGDIVTSIEPTVEGYLEKIIGQAAAEWHPDEIGGIIMDPKTGSVVAMSSLPTFDPNDVSSVKDASVFSNPLVEHVYEMGSIMKPLTMAMGLDSGAITASSTYEDTGTLTLSGKKISNFDGKARGKTDMQQILSQSLNIGAATIALKAGKENMLKYFTSFGFDEKTGIDAPNEAANIVGNLKTGRDIEVATAAYGQGIAVSPISMARALSILANGGYVVTPHIAKSIEHADGTSDVITVEKEGPVLKKSTTDEVTRMLVQVVDTALKKGAIKMDRYSIAAKTGTAQIPDHVNGGYYGDRYLHSFFGYFPAYEPRFIVFLYQIHPKGAQFASETLTDPFDDLAKFLISYYNIPPDR